jgi:RimJ/RimL family protein N-acetyltransferase
VPTRRFPSEVQTARLIGRRPEVRSVRGLDAIYGDPAIPEEMYPMRFRTPGRAAAVGAGMVAHWQEHGFGPWLAVERETGALVGRVGLMTTAAGGAEAVEVGWFIARERWGRGYATELAAVAVEHAFAADGLDLDELVSFTLPTNTASLAVMGKLGFTLDREIDHAGMPHLLHRLRR